MIEGKRNAPKGNQMTNREIKRILKKAGVKPNKNQRFPLYSFLNTLLKQPSCPEIDGKSPRLGLGTGSNGDILVEHGFPSSGNYTRAVIRKEGSMAVRLYDNGTVIYGYDYAPNNNFEI